MTRTDSNTAERSFTGRMFLYGQPELLTKADHGALGLSRVERPYDFAKAARAIPLVSVEFASAQKHYPIVFSDTEIPMPLAMVGIVEDVNLFVDESGNWERHCYVPFYVRCHPIGFAKAQNGQLAVLIDRAAPSIADNPEEPFFDGEKLSPPMQRRVDLAAQYNAERQRTQELARHLKELDLFTGQAVRHTSGDQEQPLGTYAAVDVDKLGKLDSGALHRLHQEGWLSAIYAHVFSLENWSRLLDLRAARASHRAEETKEEGR